MGKGYRVEHNLLFALSACLLHVPKTAEPVYDFHSIFKRYFSDRGTSISGGIIFSSAFVMDPINDVRVSCQRVTNLASHVQIHRDMIVNCDYILITPPHRM